MRLNLPIQLLSFKKTLLHQTFLLLVSFHNSIYNTINRIIKGVVMGAIVANDLKTKGIKAIEDALLGHLEAPVSVRGQVKYVVMSQQQYE